MGNENQVPSDESNDLLQHRINQLEKNTEELKKNFDSNLPTRIDSYLGNRSKTIDRMFTLFGIVIPIILSIAGLNLYLQIKKTETDSVAALNDIRQELKNIQSAKEAFEKYKKETDQEFKDIKKKLESDRDFVENTKRDIAKSKDEIEGYTKSTKGQVETIKSLTDIAQKAAIQAEYNRLITDADNFSKDKRYKEAIETLNKVLTIFAGDAMIFNNLANNYSMMQEYQKAIEYYNKAIAVDSNNAIFYNNRANAEIKIKQFDNALLDFDKAILLSKNNTVIQENLSSELGVINFAVIPENEIKIDCYYKNKGTVLLFLKKYQDAIYNYEKAVELNSTNYSSYFGLATAQMHLELCTNAIKNFKKAISLNSNDSKVYTNYGTTLLKLEKYQDAIDILNKAISLDKNNAVAFYQRAFAEIMLNKLDVASEDISVSIKIQPTGQAYMYRTLINCHLNRINDAIDSLSYAIKLSPENPEFYFNRATIYLLQDSPDWEQALSDINRINMLEKNDLINSYLPVWNELLKQIKEQKAVNSDEILKMLQNIKNKSIALNHNIFIVINKFSPKKNYNWIQRLFFSIGVNE